MAAAPALRDRAEAGPFAASRRAVGRCDSGAAVVAALLVAPLWGCAASLATRLNTAAESGHIPAGLEVVYDDYHPLWGGLRIEVNAAGALDAHRWRPGDGSDDGERWAGRVSAAELDALLAVLVDIEAWAQRTEGPETRIDEGRASLVVRLGGQSSRIWEWSNDLHANRRIIRIKDYLETWAFRSQRPSARPSGPDGDGGEQGVEGERRPVLSNEDIEALDDDGGHRAPRRQAPPP